MAVNITIGVNSWVTLTEAIDYFNSRINSAEWLSLSSDLQKQYLISAFRWIYYSGKWSISKTSTDEKVKIAQIEAALWMLNYYADYEKRQALQAGGVSDFTISKFSETLTGITEFPKFIDEILDDYNTSSNYFPNIQRDND